MIDVYATFDALAARAIEGTDYRITTKKTNAPYLIMAIHGGRIESFTSDIATSIAGEEYSLYMFEGIKEKENGELHITNEYFDEPRAKDMIRSADVVVAIHGHRDTESEFAMVGGLCEELAEMIRTRLSEVDVSIRQFESRLHPESIRNICNQGMSGGGVEIMVSGKLRDSLREDAGLCRLFINAVRHAIAAYRPE